MTDHSKKANREAMNEVNQLIADRQEQSIKLKFRPWIPKGSSFKTPVRFYVDAADNEYIFKHKNKLIVYCESKNRQLLIENFLLDNDIDIKSMKSLGELNDYLNRKNLLVKKTLTTKQTNNEETPKKGKEAQLSKLKKGDKLRVRHGDKEVIITITHIELEKGVPSVNLSCSGDEDIHVITDVKGKTHSKRSDRIKGSNKGRGWSKRGASIKK